GWTVHHAASLHLAEEVLARRDFQAILSDLHLGDGSALSLIESLRRQEPAERATPILVTTADLTDAARQACLTIGADRVIAKPVQGPELVATLADVLMSHAAEMPSLPQLRRRLAG
ncbi:MAG: response regulator, partial [Alphaproteobacteria bacterium]|nr:response regulator [Alphaproteobacteria bacterium]